MRDIRDDLFRSIYGRRFRAALTAERAGVLAGTEAAKAQADELGIELELCKADGEELMHGERIGTLVAAAKQVALAEERMIRRPGEGKRDCYCGPYSGPDGGWTRRNCVRFLEKDAATDQGACTRCYFDGWSQLPDCRAADDLSG